MAGRPADAGGGGAAAAAAAAEGRQIDAFTVHDVVADKRLLCLEAWGSYVLLGLSGGRGIYCGQRVFECLVLACDQVGSLLMSASPPSAIPAADGTLLLASQQPRGLGSAATSRQASGTPAGGTPAGGSPRGSTPGGGTPAAGTPQAGSEAGGSDTEGQAAEGQQEQPWRVVRSLREFGKGRVKQLVVAKERSMLLCLAGESAERGGRRVCLWRLLGALARVLRLAPGGCGSRAAATAHQPGVHGHAERCCFRPAPAE